MEFDQSVIEVDHSNISNLKTILDIYGVAIVKSVLDEYYCQQIFSEITGVLNQVTSNMKVPFKVNDYKTWESLDLLCPTRGMIFQNWGLGHMQPIWDLRCNQKIIDIYNNIYNFPKGSKDLIVSSDAFSFLPPSEYSKKNWEPDNGRWYHVDQRLVLPLHENYQSWISVSDTNKGDGTLSVLIGSHHFHNSIPSITGISNLMNDWVPIKNYQPFIERGCTEHRIICPKGSLVLWDSRLIHYGALPLQSREKPNFRCVIYLCYSPRYKADRETLNKKIESLTKRDHGYLRTSNHNPHRPNFFPAINRFSTVLPLSISNPDIKEGYEWLIGY